MTKGEMETRKEPVTFECCINQVEFYSLPAGAGAHL